MPLELLHCVGPACSARRCRAAARRIATADSVGGGVTIAVTAIGGDRGRRAARADEIDVATLWIAVPAGVTVCARAGRDDSNSKPASATPARRAIHAPIDTPRAGRLFTVPPALCVTAANDGLCIDQLLIVTRNVTVAVPPFAAHVAGTDHHVAPADRPGSSLSGSGPAFSVMLPGTERGVRRNVVGHGHGVGRRRRAVVRDGDRVLDHRARNRLRVAACR